MKTFFLFFIFCSVQSFAQPTITAVSQSWAGGFSYAHGTNYSITVTWSNTCLQDAAISSVCIGGYIFTNDMLQITQTANDSLTTINIQAGIRFGNQTGPGYSVTGNKQPAGCHENSVYYTKVEYTGMFYIMEVTDLFPVAFP